MIDFQYAEEALQCVRLNGHLTPPTAYQADTQNQSMVDRWRVIPMTPNGELMVATKLNVQPYKGASGNFFFLSHKKKFMFMSVAKNACSSLKQMLYQVECPTAPERTKNFHSYWGFRARKGRLVEARNKDELAKYEGYTRFVVFRDPVERFLSAYHNKVLYSPNPHPFYTRRRLEGLALNPFLDVVEELLKIEDPLHIDEHIRPQRRYYKDEDVDYIVRIDGLNRFLEEKFNIASVPRRNCVRLPKITPTPTQVARIEDLYREDRSIQPNYPPAAAIGEQCGTAIHIESTPKSEAKSTKI